MEYFGNTWEGADAYLRASNRGRGMEQRKIGNNTVLIRRTHDTIAVRLHGTDVVTYHRNGTMHLNTGGYDTVTTLSRIHHFSPVCTYRDKGVRVVSHTDDPLTPPRIVKCSGERSGGGWSSHRQTTARCRDGKTTRERFEHRECNDTACTYWQHTSWDYTVSPAVKRDWAPVRHDISIGIRSGVCTSCNGAGTVDRGSRPDPIVWEGRTITIDSNGRVVHDNGDPMVNARRLSRRVRERQAAMRAEREERARKARKVGDGVTLFYKGVTQELRSPMHTHEALTYTPGTLVSAPTVDLDPWNGCAPGINIVRTIRDAAGFGPIVVSVTIPHGATYVDAGDKLRTQAVNVVEILPADRVRG